MDESRACTAALAISSSVHSLEVGRCTSTSFTIARTPETREAVRSALHFSQKLLTWPLSVTTPSFAATPISAASMLASQLSSVSTLRFSSRSVFALSPLSLQLAPGSHACRSPLHPTNSPCRKFTSLATKLDWKSPRVVQMAFRPFIWRLQVRNYSHAASSPQKCSSDLNVGVLPTLV
jgi:hypothetical protein